MTAKPVIIGTAGHIDHGKTALVKALTGTNTDRLKEEQERGITIALGYAFLTPEVAIIDVPGHERFVRNMVAGVATVDCALLVVAADDGIMPQTREHFEILRLLGITDGIVAITKTSLVDNDWLQLVEEDIRDMIQGSFLETGPIIHVDSLSGEGVDAVHDALIHMAGACLPRPSSAIFRLPIDRVFSIKGFGTVVTGSALSGQVRLEDKLVRMPGGDTVRVRGLESGGVPVTEATAGMRVALNLPNIATTEISHGDVLATPGHLTSTFLLDVECQVLRSCAVPLTQRQRVRVHVGTKELMARVMILETDTIEPGESGLIQLRLEEQTAVMRLDRYVIRHYSPQFLIGGGKILDANPSKHKMRNRTDIVSSLSGLDTAKDEQLVLRLIGTGGYATRKELLTRTGFSAEKLEESLGRLSTNDEVMEIDAKGDRFVIARSYYQAFLSSITEHLHRWHRDNPLQQGARRGEVHAVFKKTHPDFIIAHFSSLALAFNIIKQVSTDRVALFAFEVQLTEPQRRALATIEHTLLDQSFHPPDVSELGQILSIKEQRVRDLLQVLVDNGTAVNIEGKIYFHEKVVARGRDVLRVFFQRHPSMTLSDLRQALDTTRKYAMPLANYYDNKGYTVRQGEVRIPGGRLFAAETLPSSVKEQ